MPVSPIRRLAVFCAGSPGIRPIYAGAAEELGCALGARSIGLIYGGGNVGLMQVVAAACLRSGGSVTGVIPQVLVDKEVADHGITELHVVDTMHTRKALMSDLADAFLILPGGIGTLEELFEVITWQSIGLHTKPVLLVNIAGFYDHLLAFLDHCVAEGMLRPAGRNGLLVADTIDEALLQLGISDPEISDTQKR